MRGLRYIFSARPLAPDACANLNIIHFISNTIAITTCPWTKCRHDCRFGFHTDIFGCRTCLCKCKSMYSQYLSLFESWPGFFTLYKVLQKSYIQIMRNVKMTDTGKFPLLELLFARKEQVTLRSTQDQTKN